MYVCIHFVYWLIEIVKEKEQLLKMDEILQNERITHQRLMKSMESNIEAKTRQINSLLADLDECRKELKASRIQCDNLESVRQEYERDKDKWRLRYQQLVKEIDNRKLLEKESGGLAILKDKAEQSVMWEAEATMWKNKYDELQLILEQFNFSVQKASGIHNDGMHTYV
jgi:hypothetical protein